MMSANVFCQDTIEVKATTIDSIIKDLQKCDSLKVAYKKQTIILTNLVKTNLDIYNKIQNLEIQKNDLSGRIERFEAQTSKVKRKPFSLGIYIGYGANSKGLSPQVGIGLSYSLFRF